MAAIVVGIFLFFRPGPTAVFLIRVMADFLLVGASLIWSVGSHGGAGRAHPGAPSAVS